MEPSDQLKALRQQPYAVQGRGGDRRRMENSVRLPLGKAILCAPAEEVEKVVEIWSFRMKKEFATEVGREEIIRKWFSMWL